MAESTDVNRFQTPPGTASRPITPRPDTPVGQTAPIREYETSGSYYSQPHALHPAAVARVSWGALVAGLVTYLSLQALFAVLGAAIGLSVLDAAGSNASQEVSIGAGIWWLVTGLIALFIGGFVAARCAGVPDREDAGAHGFLTWALSTVAGAILVGVLGMGSLAGGSMALMSQNQNPGVQQQQRFDGQSGLQQDIRDTANQASRSITGQSTGNQPVNQARVDRATQQTADTLMPAAWWTFVALLLGAIVTTIGGVMGVPQRATAIPLTGSGRHLTTEAGSGHDKP